LIKKGWPVATPIHESLSSAAQKIQGIVEAAEEAARAIQSEAEVDAGRYREERRRETDALAAERADRLNELSVSLGEHAVRVRSAVQSLASELDRAADELRGDTTPPSHPSQHEEKSQHEENGDAPEGGSDDSRPGWFRRLAQTPEAVADSAAGDAASGRHLAAADGPGDVPVPDEALLRATQMAVAGRSREEIEETLRRDFALSNPEAVVDDISRPRRGELRG
jgi:hypothetical protein